MELGNLLFGNARGAFPVSRNWQDAFADFLTTGGFDGYGGLREPESQKAKPFIKEIGDHEGFENGVFAIFPYYWGDGDEERAIPNFWHKSSGFEMKWYKYPLRDSYMNQDVDFSRFAEMLSECQLSVLGKSGIEAQIKKAEDQIEKKKRELEHLEDKKKQWTELAEKADKIL